MNQMNQLQEFAARGVASQSAADAVIARHNSGQSIETFVPLSFTERMKLKACEENIQQALEAGAAAEQALIEIREKRLYREQYSTFEEYCEKRWKKGGRRIRQLMDFAEVKADIVQAGAASLPVNERQARALKQLPSGQRPQAWGEAVSTAGPGKQPTGKQVAAVVDRKLGKSKVQEPELKLETVTTAPSLRGNHLARTQSLVRNALATLREGQRLFGAVEWDGTGPGMRWMASVNYQFEHALDHAACVDGLLARGDDEDDLNRKGKEHRREKVIPGGRGADAGFVICREPLKGATSPTAVVPRYDTGGGWTNDPAKAHIFADRSDAVVRAARHNDKVMELAKAVRRFKHRL